MNVGKRLKLLREEKNLSQKELQEILLREYDFKTTAASIGNYEREDREADYNTLKVLADFYNVSLDWLFGRSEYRDVSEQLLKISMDYKNYKLIDTHNFLISELIRNKILQSPDHFNKELVYKIINLFKNLSDLNNSINEFFDNSR